MLGSAVLHSTSFQQYRSVLFEAMYYSCPNLILAIIVHSKICLIVALWPQAKLTQTAALKLCDWFKLKCPCHTYCILTWNIYLHKQVAIFSTNFHL
jgi:hypothetical protein